jgi:tetratricopeptide (TPR) repeat protein
MKRSSDNHQFLIVFRWAFVIFVFSTWSNAQTPAPLPPLAQEAFDKGIIAAKIPDYLLAIRYFQEARKIAPNAPVIYLNLGLAESKIPGRELRAIAWFGAYLAANPTASNAMAVKEQIAVLDVKSQSNLSRLIRLVQDASEQIPEDTQGPTMGRDRSLILNEVSNLWSSIGDIERAQRCAELIKSSHFAKGMALNHIAWAQLRAGDIVGAQKTANLIVEEDYKSATQKAIDEARKGNQPAGKDVIVVNDWLILLGVGKQYWITGTLNTELFRDLNGFLKSFPLPSGSVYENFWALSQGVQKAVKAQEEIHEMLKQQAIMKHVKPL